MGSERALRTVRCYARAIGTWRQSVVLGRSALLSHRPFAPVAFCSRAGESQRTLAVAVVENVNGTIQLAALAALFRFEILEDSIKQRPYYEHRMAA